MNPERIKNRFNPWNEVTRRIYQVTDNTICVVVDEPTLQTRQVLLYEYDTWKLLETKIFKLSLKMTNEQNWMKKWKEKYSTK